MVGCYQRFGGKIFSPEDGSSLFLQKRWDQASRPEHGVVTQMSQ
jgi:hypothetical protein